MGIAELTYKGIHTKLRRNLGPASDYACEDCGSPAAEWSYEHGKDPQDLNSYAARCRACHRKFDGVVPPSPTGRSSACRPGCQCGRHKVKPGTRGGSNYCEPNCRCGKRHNR